VNFGGLSLISFYLFSLLSFSLRFFLSKGQPESLLSVIHDKIDESQVRRDVNSGAMKNCKVNEHPVQCRQ
jgi:hypothetical protein